MQTGPCDHNTINKNILRKNGTWCRVDDWWWCSWKKEWKQGRVVKLVSPDHIIHCPTHAVTTPSDYTYWQHALVTPTSHNFQPYTSFFQANLLACSRKYVRCCLRLTWNAVLHMIPSKLRSAAACWTLLGSLFGCSWLDSALTKHLHSICAAKMIVNHVYKLTPRASNRTSVLRTCKNYAHWHL